VFCWVQRRLVTVFVHLINLHLHYITLQYIILGCVFHCRMVLEVLGLPAVSRFVGNHHGCVVGNGCLVGVSLLCPISNSVPVCSPRQCCQDQLQLSCYWGTDADSSYKWALYMEIVNGLSWNLKWKTESLLLKLDWCFIRYDLLCVEWNVKLCSLTCC